DGRLVDLEVVHGVVAAVADADAAAGPPGAGTARAESGAADDLGGLLVLPAPAEPHAHLDKAFTAERVPNPTGDLIGAVDAWLAARPGLSTEDVVERATAGVRHALVHGHTAIRTHVDVGEGIEL